ncbi:MAG: integrase family protein [Polaromonas sp.]|nr:integrase family protein [Polaromonas sp.]
MKKQANRVRLTAGRVDSFTCPTDKPQAFLWDTDTPTLALRATPTGRKTYVFESRINGATVRINIGTLADWPIEKARTRAQGLKMLVDAGTDPREVERDRQAAAFEKKAAAAAHAVTVGEVWSAYLEARRPNWGERHYSDHEALTKAGGEVAKRGTRGRGVTIAGPLFSLLHLPLRDLDAPTIEAWAAREAKTRPTSARLAWRCLKAFLGWCAEQSEYAPVLQSLNAAKTKKTREALGKAGVKQDALMREQLTVWFDAVRQIHNPVIAAYLQTLLLTGARPGEVLALRWNEINTKWRGLTIRDKVEGERVIPLTPYVSNLLHALPRRNEWVFSSLTAANGVLTIPRNQHNEACKVAGIDGLTLHGLRRSFKSLTEWLEVPAGVVAQLMGHKPSATAEKHYTVRPLDLLRVHHEKIEAWILEQAGIVFNANAAPGALRIVAG